MKPAYLLPALLLLSLHAPSAASTDLPVIIVGAGMAGAKLAYDLSRAGQRFLIVEATDRAGGRIREASLGPGGPRVELGANWVQGFRRGDAYSDFVASTFAFANITTDFDDAYFVRDGALVPDEEADPVWERAERAMARLYRLAGGFSRGGVEKFDISVKAGLLLAAGWEADTPIEHAAMRLEIDYEYAVPVSQLSIHDLSEFYDPKSPPSEDVFINDPRGYREIVNWHLREAGVVDVESGGGKLMLNSPVRTIAYGKRGASVTLRDGRQIEGAAVVSTVPLGVLQEALFRKPKEPSRLIFRPPLPFRKRLAISHMEIADYEKIFVRFKTAVFTSEDPLFLLPLECSEGGLLNVHNLNKEGYFPGLNTVLVTATGAFSRDIVCMDDEMRLREVLKFVSKAAGREIAVEEVETSVFPNFRQNEFFKGAYTIRPPGLSDVELRALNKPLGALFFAGEAHSETRSGYVQGAYFSAEDTAKDVLQFLQS